jgi:hypothetical protein
LYCWSAKPQTSTTPLFSTWTFFAISSTWSHVRRLSGSVPGSGTPAALKRSTLQKRPTLVDPIGAVSIFPWYVAMSRSTLMKSSTSSLVQ